MYNDGPDSGSSAPADESEDEGGETALLPKSLCPGMKPGDEIMLKIDSVQEDQYVVSYPPKESASEEKSDTAPEGSSGDKEMASMME